MVKEVSTLSICFLLAAGVAGCSGVRSATEAAPAAFELDSGVRQLWSARMPGLITDLNVAGNGASVLLALVPDPERFEKGGISEYQARRLSRNGKVLWATDLKAQIKYQAISEDGSFVVLSTHHGDLMALDASGRELWTIEANCRPYLLNKSGRIVCHHDDDAEPGTAFDVYDWHGKKRLTYPSVNDILALKPSRDENAMTIGLTRGQVILFNLADGAFRALWQRKVPGEVIDVAAGNAHGESGLEPRAAVLFLSSKLGQRIGWFDQHGKALAVVTAPFHVDQIEIAPDGDGFLFYGNGPQGQNLAYFRVDERKGSATEVWRRASPRFADYTSSVSVAADGPIVGLEEKNAVRSTQLVAFDWIGQKKWRLPVVTEEGAYLYSFARISNGFIVAIGNDDSLLSLFQVFL